jgi:hypothetical protein
VKTPTIAISKISRAMCCPVFLKAILLELAANNETPKKEKQSAVASDIRPGKSMEYGSSTKSVSILK